MTTDPRLSEDALVEQARNRYANDPPFHAAVVRAAIIAGHHAPPRDIHEHRLLTAAVALEWASLEPALTAPQAETGDGDV